MTEDYPPVWKISDPKFITTKEMRAAEKNLYSQGISPLTLMRRAGIGAAKLILKEIKPKKNVVVFSGFGNNGGDGLVVATHLEENGIETTVYLVGNKEKPSSEEARESLSQYEHVSGKKCNKIEKLDREIKKELGNLIDKDTVVVDALLGTGIKGEVRDPIKSVLSLFKKYEKIVSIDIPSGMDSDTGEWLGPEFDPVMIPTFHKPKTGLKKLYKEGKVKVVDIGIPPQAEHYIGLGHLKEFWPKRPLETHKGKNGRIMIIGGSIEYTGAPVLSAMGALRAGADTVRIVVPDAISTIVAGHTPDFIVTRVPGQYHHPANVKAIARLALERHDTVVLGMGISNQPEAWAFAREFVQTVKGQIKLVLDADGIRAFQGHLDILKGSNVIITPHKRELAWLMNEDNMPKTYMDKAKYIKKVAKELGIVLILKGRYDLISDGNRVLVNLAGHPGMSVGGSGDVLAGVVGFASSKIENRLYAAAMGVYVTCKGGEMAAQQYGNSLVATDLPISIAKFLKMEDVNN